MSQMATVPRGTVAALRHLPFWDKCHFLSTQKKFPGRQKSQGGKCLRAANVPRGTFAILGHLPLWYKCHFQPISVKLCQNGKCLRVANVSGWQMSQSGKCPRAANVQDGKCHGRQKSEGKCTIFWVLVESGICPRKANVQSGKCHGRQMSQGGKWKAANVQKMK